MHTMLSSQVKFMTAQRIRHWASNEPTLAKHPVSAGIAQDACVTRCTLDSVDFVIKSSMNKSHEATRLDTATIVTNCRGLSESECRGTTQHYFIWLGVVSSSLVVRSWCLLSPSKHSASKHWCINRSDHILQPERPQPSDIGRGVSILEI